MTRSICLPFACAAMLLAHGFASAQGANRDKQLGDLTALPLESLLALEVQSASRFRQNISDAPSAVSVITAAEIKTFGWRTLAEILNSLPGIHLTNDRTYTYLGARGFLRGGDTNTRFLLMVDGHRTNDPLYDQAMMGQEFIVDVDLIDRVEYVPGPGSAVYGSNAFFGVINVITKRGRDISGVQLSGELGSAGMHRQRATLGGTSDNGVEWLISATNYNRDGKSLAFPGYYAGIVRNLDQERSQNLFFKASAGAFSLSLAHAERKKAIPTASYEQEFNDPRSGLKDTTSFIDLGYGTSLSDKTDFSARLQYSQQQYSGTYVYDDGPDFDYGKSVWWGGEAKIVSRAFEGHKLVSGVEFQRNHPVSQLNYSGAPGEPATLNLSNSNSRIGLFLQDEWAFRSDWLLSMGLRYDHNTKVAEKNMINPRLGLIYRLQPGTTFKALFGKAYRLPNFYEMYYDDGDTQLANPGLRPERIRSSELVMEHHWSSQSRLRLSAYYNKVKDLISSVDAGGGATRFENVDGAIARGAEIELQHVWRNGAKLRGSISWQRATDESSGQVLANAPKWLGKMNLSIPFWHGLWRAGIETQYVSMRRTVQDPQAGGYTLANLTLFSDRIYPKTELSAGIYNLFDHRYGHPPGPDYIQNTITQDGRNVRVKLTYSF